MKKRYEISPRTLCLIKNKNKILLIEYSQRKGEMYGFFNALGGHIEFGEGIIESANREIFEESWLKLNKTKLKWVAHFTNFFWENGIMFITLSKTKKSNFIESDEWKLHWIKIDEIEKLNIFKDVKILINKINTLDKNEIFTAKIEFDWKWELLKIDFE